VAGGRIIHSSCENGISIIEKENTAAMNHNRCCGHAGNISYKERLK
jgi:hypothetical protein